MKFGEALTGARKIVPATEARLLLRHVTGATATELAAHPEREMAPRQVPLFMSLLSRRAAGEPIAYLIGVREFYGRDYSVTPDVLIPRPETELLVDIAREKLGAGGTARILDLGTGSGCLAVTLALELPQARVMAVDVSPAALEVARGNAARLGAQVAFIESDWFAALPALNFDLIVANPPYVAAGDPHLNEGDLRFEPVGALTDHADEGDGLAAIRRIVTAAPQWLATRGWLFFEHGYDQAAIARQLLDATGFSEIEQYCDLAGIVRASGGRYCISRE